MSPGKPEGVTTWKDIYGREAQWNGVAWELVKGSGDFDTESEKQKPAIKAKKNPNLKKHPVYVGHFKYSGIRARGRLESQDQDDPVIQAYNGLSDEQLGTIRGYTYNYYIKINSVLRGRESRDGWEDEEERDFIKQRAGEMVDSLNSIPNSPEGRYYRGMSGDPETSPTVQSYIGLESGDIISDKGFGSFSSDLSVTDDFMTYGGRNQNILLINKSSRLKSLEPVTANPGEYENVSMPGAEFKVVKNEIVDSKKFGRMRVIQITDG